MAVIAPANDDELCEAVRTAKAPFEIVGLGTKRGFGRPVEASARLDLSGFAGIRSYEPEELVLEAGAATPLAEIHRIVAARNQMLAFEPPDLSAALGGSGPGTIGGVVACNLSGPRRLKAGAARDHLLGVTGVNGAGEPIRTGAKVVKNVTGYDLPKLMAGSFGTLMSFTTVTLKVLPKPEHQETLVLANLDAATAVTTMSRAMQSPAEVSAAAYLPGEGAFIRLEGIPASIAYRRERLMALLGGDIARLDSEASAQRWRDIAAVKPLAGDADRVLWRLSVPPMDAPAVIDTLTARVDARYLVDWAGGLIWLDLPYAEDGHAALVRGALAAGHATLMRAPTGLRARADVFQPQPAALRSLSARVKAAFDPRGLFNPGRMYKGL